MSDDAQIKKFVFSGNPTNLEIFIPELLQASYSFYTWPAAPVLAQYLWEHRNELANQNILELGSGTSLPGILAAKCGARVTLTDSQTLPKSLAHIERSCALNNLQIDKHVRVVGLTWGLFLSNVFKLGPVDVILGSDCFYEPCVFEDVIATVSHILEQNPGGKFLCAYQERSSDWSIEHLLTKWELTCKILQISDSSGDHTIHLLEITRVSA